MTITSAQLSVTWLGNGLTQTFDYPFLIPSPGQCTLVSITGGVETPIAPGLFSISNTGNATGGTLTYPITGGPMPSGTSLILTRKVPYQQAYHPAVNGPIYNPTLESALDALAMQIMQAASQLGEFTVNGNVVTSANFTGALSVSIANGVATVNVQTTPGPQGVQGAMGATGATGATGAQGTRGSIWIDGSGAPGSIGGTIAGDQYLDTVTGNVYQLGSGGAWTKTADIMGPQGQQGIQGATGSGSSVLVNNGATALGTATTIEADGTTLQVSLNDGVANFSVLSAPGGGGISYGGFASGGTLLCSPAPATTGETTFGPFTTAAFDTTNTFQAVSGHVYLVDVAFSALTQNGTVGGNILVCPAASPTVGYFFGNSASFSATYKVPGSGSYTKLNSAAAPSFSGAQREQLLFCVGSSGNLVFGNSINAAVSPLGYDATAVFSEQTIQVGYQGTSTDAYIIKVYDLGLITAAL